MVVINKHNYTSRLMWLCLAILLILSVIEVQADKKTDIHTDIEMLDVRVVVPHEFPPHYLTNKKGQTTGFAIDILNAIAELARLRLTYQIENSWTDVYAVMDSDQADLIPNLGISQKRLAKYYFTSPVETSHLSIFVRKANTTIHHKKDLFDHDVGVVKGNIAVSLLKKEQNLKIIEYPDPQNALFALLSGEVNVIVYPENVMQKIAQSINVEQRIKVTGIPIIEIKRAIAIQKDNKELVVRLESAIKNFLGSDKYQEIYVKWYGKKEPYWTAGRIGWLVSGLLLSLLILLLVLRYITTAKFNRQLTQNIKERIKAEKSLKESESELQYLLETLPQGLALCRMDGELIKVNKAYANILGRTVEDTLKLSYWDITPKKYELDEKKQLQLLNKTGTYGPYIKEYIHKDGQFIPVQLTGCLIKRGNEYYIWSIVENITKRLKTEETLRRAHKMEAIGQFTGGIAHDFNNLLGIILGNLELLNNIIPSEEKFQKRLSEIQKASERAAKLTKQLLGFSRQKPAKKTVIQINKIITGMDSLLSRVVTPEVEINHHFSKDLWLTEIDPGDFEDALLNLCINACDAMKSHGRVKIETKNKTLDTEFCSQNPEVIVGDYVEIAVSDTGIGISTEDQEKIFEPFFTTKAQGKGTGLGLAMVYGFAKRSNGFIKCYSELGVGTTFSLFIPRAVEKQENEDIASEQQADSFKIEYQGTETVLIVDDEPGLLQLAKDNLESLGYQVLTASNGQQALECINHNPTIKLLFSDVVMPGGLNGFELAEKASEQHPSLKILLTSGYIDKAIQRTGQAKFSVDLLGKPYTQFEMAKRIRAKLDA